VFNWIKSHWALLTVILTGPFAAAIIPIVKNWAKIRAAAQAVFDFFKGAWQGVGNLISGPFRAAFNVIVGIFTRIWAWIQKILHAPGNLLGKVGGFFGKGFKWLGGKQHGGYISETGLALLHAGETVIPSYANAGRVGQGVMVLGDITLVMDQKVVARLTRDELLRMRGSRGTLGLA